MLDAVEIETQAEPSASIIFLHGLGASGHDFEPIASELKLKIPGGVRFIFPHAPKRVVTINGGLMMPAWYDILTHDIDRRVDTNQLRASAADISQLLEREIERGVDSKRIFIAGFSQGGAVGFELALSYPKPLGGLIALSTYFASIDSIDYHEANTNLDIFIAHGQFDTIVPESLGQKANTALLDAGYRTTYRRYAIDHSVCMPEIQDISKWLTERL